jgi:hypothetical protein
VCPSAAARAAQDGWNLNQDRFQTETMPNWAKAAISLRSQGVNASAKAFSHNQDPKMW